MIKLSADQRESAGGEMRKTNIFRRFLFSDEIIEPFPLPALPPSDESAPYNCCRNK